MLKNTTMGVPLKYLSNFWRLLEMPLITVITKLNKNLSRRIIVFCL